jgi:hypothetical protein
MLLTTLDFACPATGPWRALAPLVMLGYGRASFWGAALYRLPAAHALSISQEGPQP